MYMHMCICILVSLIMRLSISYYISNILGKAALISTTYYRFCGIKSITIKNNNKIHQSTLLYL